ncbi:MAG: hypothetical protein M0R33_15530 [Methylomonas sp.]|jgi:hypothetical protein|uniref:hypothetical protein n=1 Tax=Methylomonas sp. TaxID=418 RepID=UPI0025F9B94E|nr:hypothetical protein [Methylomonas sp.]MCK9607854.1 hypothetical protein [Methylomonas sp.]
MAAIVIILVILIILILFFASLNYKKKRTIGKLIHACDSRDGRRQFIHDFRDTRERDARFIRAAALAREADDAEDALAIIRQENRHHTAFAAPERIAAEQNIAHTLANIVAAANGAYEEAVELQPQEEARLWLDPFGGDNLFDEDFIARVTMDFRDRWGIAQNEDCVPPPITDEKARRWHADPQNVHDSCVANAMAQNTEYILKTSPHSLSNDQAEAQIHGIIAQEKDAQTRDKALKTLTIATTNTYCHKFAAQEMDLLSAIYERSKLPENSAQSVEMQSALVGAMADCIENGDSSVCQIGRMERYISSLDVLDPNINLAVPLDAYRKEIFDSAAKIVADIDAKTANPAADSPTNSGNESAAEEQKKQAMNALVDSYADKIPQMHLSKLRKDCLAGI